MMRLRQQLIAATSLAFATPLGLGNVAADQQPWPASPPIKHVFVIMLENKGFDTTFKPRSAAPYLADTLRKTGAFLRQYYGIAHYSLPNYLAMVSGIAATPKTQIDCPHFEEFVETGIARDGQPIGDGCVYPAHVMTLANQLENKGLTWGAFMEDMGNNPSREAATCGHPSIGSPDLTQGATPTDQYATKHNPFVYFHAILDTGSCARNVVPLTRLQGALSSVDRTPNYSFIVPNICRDGHDRPCKNGEPGGLVSADVFLRHWIPIITASPAYKADGLIIITFDEALSIEAEACCKEPTGPNVTKPGVNGPGGGRTGAVVLSRFIRPRTVSDVPYNHYSLLRTVEDIFGLPHLGYAAQAGLAAFGRDVFTR